MATEKMEPMERRIAEIFVERATKAIELLNLAAANARDLTLEHGWDIDDSVLREAAAKVAEEALGTVQAIAREDGWKHAFAEERK